jgi:hypothetical protein
MVVQPSNQSEPSAELRPLNHDEFFTGTFKQKRLAKAFLRIMLPGELFTLSRRKGSIKAITSTGAIP